jgi:hypothetical protein
VDSTGSLTTDHSEARALPLATIKLHFYQYHHISQSRLGISCTLRVLRKRIKGPYFSSSSIPHTAPLVLVDKALSQLTLSSNVFTNGLTHCASAHLLFTMEFISNIISAFFINDVEEKIPVDSDDGTGGSTSCVIA